MESLDSNIRENDQILGGHRVRALSNPSGHTPIMHRKRVAVGSGEESLSRPIGHHKPARSCKGSRVQAGFKQGSLRDMPRSLDKGTGVPGWEIGWQAIECDPGRQGADSLTTYPGRGGPQSLPRRLALNHAPKRLRDRLPSHSLCHSIGDARRRAIGCNWGRQWKWRESTLGVAVTSLRFPFYPRYTKRRSHKTGL